MNSDREQAINDVSDRATLADVVAYAVFQRERVIELERDNAAKAERVLQLERALREYIVSAQPTNIRALIDKETQ